MTPDSNGPFRTRHAADRDGGSAYRARLPAPRAMPQDARTMRRAPALAVPMLAALLLSAGCASVPGKTGEEQAIAIEDLEKRTLADVQAQDSTATEKLEHCAGYVILNNKLTKIPLIGVGAGYGVALDKATGTRTYLRMRRFDIGAGWGVRVVRPV